MLKEITLFPNTGKSISEKIFLNLNLFHYSTCICTLLQDPNIKRPHLTKEKYNLEVDSQDYNKNNPLNDLREIENILYGYFF